MSKSNQIHWQWLSFDALSVGQLYQSLKLRQDVFIIEQDCIYADLDDLDYHCMHLLGYVEGPNEDELVAYLRLIPGSIKPLKLLPNNTIALGRIVTCPTQRQHGIGKELMAEVIAYTTEHYANDDIQIGAQCYLQNFYERFNFKLISEPYDEDGIMHVNMLRTSG